MSGSVPRPATRCAPDAGEPGYSGHLHCLPQRQVDTKYVGDEAGRNSSGEIYFLTLNPLSMELWKNHAILDTLYVIIIQIRHP